MKKTERVVAPQVEHYKVVEVTCDMCGAKTRRVDGFSTDWGNSEYTALSASRFIDSEEFKEEFKDEADVCYECTSYLIDMIKTGGIKRSADWVNTQ